MPPTSAEIKFTVQDTAKVQAALDLLPLPADSSQAEIYFIEDVPGGATSGTPLFDEHVVLRARKKHGDTDDFTVKIRPCRLSQITDELLSAAEGEADWFKLEADWAGEKKVLAASLTEEVDQGRIAAVRDGDLRLSELFTDRQKDFLRDCVGIPLNLHGLTLLKTPVSATKWGKFPLPHRTPKVEVRAERWIVDSMDFLELSILSPLVDADAEKADLEKYLVDLGLQLPEEAVTKTERVLKRLVALQVL